jgi:hypothetical protein
MSWFEILSRFLIWTSWVWWVSFGMIVAAVVLALIFEVISWRN